MKFSKTTLIPLILTLSFALVSCVSVKNEIPKSEPIQEMVAEVAAHSSIALSPQATLESIELPEGYSLELVLSEPQIDEPVLAVFDGNGRMYVAEMRTYMQDIDATGEFEKTSRVSMHEDTNGDGEFDRHTVFADNLLLPRMVLPLDDRIIIGETNTNDLYSYRDTDGDGVADEKELWFEGGDRGGNLEHQPSGLFWAMDNGIYTTYNDYRYRFTSGEVVKEEIPRNGGQWGVTQDDFGKVWFVHAGRETGPTFFQQHILYGQFAIEGERTPGYKEVWAIDNIPDTQGGLFQLRDNNTLNHFTATCGQDIFRGDRLPEDLRGDLLFAEPVGRLIRRTKINVEDGITRLSNAYDETEFMRTKDPLFRPVNMVTAPDGTLYVVDMYRGIIQEGNWTREGSYLRGAIQDNDLDKEVGRGRVYRLVHEDFEKGPQPKMLDETPAQLVKHLEHPNGWWRDTAQKLLILKADESVVPALKELFRSPSSDTKAKAHALWTLEGLGQMNEALAREAMKSSDVEIRHAGIRLAEPFIEGELLADVKDFLDDEDPNLVIQSMLSLKYGGVAEAETLAKAAAESSSSEGVYAINEQLWEKTEEDPFLMSLLGPAGLKSYRRGRSFYNSLCYSCHGSDGLGTPSVEGKTIAPSLAGSPRVLGSSKAATNVLLHGLQGVIDGVDYGAPMITMASYSDEQLADVLTYVRNSFGNRSSVVEIEDIASTRVHYDGRTAFWTMKELTTELPYLAVPIKRFEKHAEWKMSASHDTEEAVFGVDENSETVYETGSTPYPGMWYQVELPAVSTVNSILMDSTDHEGSFPPSYEVSVSMDGENWGSPVHVGSGEIITQIHLEEPVEAKFVRVTITKKHGWQRWAIIAFELYGEEG